MEKSWVKRAACSVCVLTSLFSLFVSVIGQFGENKKHTMLDWLAQDEQFMFDKV